MDWNEILQWSQKGFIASCALVVQMVLALATGQQAENAKPKVSNQPVTDEALGVYHAVLSDWADDGKSAVHLAAETIALPSDALEGCPKNIEWEKSPAAEVHRFREDDVPKLGSSKISLVERDAQEKEIAKNDPGAAIRKGKSVDDAVRSGFASGMVTLSEIRFDARHEHAIVWYGFHCGSLCGSGGTVVMERKDGAWRRNGYCSMWISNAPREVRSTACVAL